MTGVHILLYSFTARSSFLRCVGGASASALAAFTVLCSGSTLEHDSQCAPASDSSSLRLAPARAPSLVSCHVVISSGSCGPAALDASPDARRPAAETKRTSVWELPTPAEASMASAAASRGRRRENRSRAQKCGSPACWTRDRRAAPSRGPGRFAAAATSSLALAQGAGCRRQACDSGTETTAASSRPQASADQSQTSIASGVR